MAPRFGGGAGLAEFETLQLSSAGQNAMAEATVTAGGVQLDFAGGFEEKLAAMPESAASERGIMPRSARLWAGSDEIACVRAYLRLR